MCLDCESGKPKDMHCQCGDERQFQVIFLEELLGKPLWHPDQRASDVIVQEGFSTSDEATPEARLVQQMVNQIEQRG